MPYVGRDKYYEEPLAQPSAMWTDMYELTMAQALFLDGRHNQQATFQAFVRKVPFGAAYMISAGQNIISEWLDKNWKFTERDLHRLSEETVVHPTTGETVKVYTPEFLEFLRTAKLEISLEAMPEGELAFAGEPVFKVTGPVWQAMLVETAILNAMNSQSLIATLASIIKTAANQKPVIEGGARRSQSVGALSSSRAAFIGGVDATSNYWARTNYGIPAKGTMAHAYIMFHDTELDAFRNWAKYMSHLATFLPDTYDSVHGIQNVITAVTEAGIVPGGARHDSDDLAHYSNLGRAAFDSIGATKAINVVSNGLGPKTINSLEQQTPNVNAYLVGTDLVTSADQPALGGVYKIAAKYDQALSHAEIVALKAAVKEGRVDPKDIRDRVTDLMKLSNETVKMTYPGELDVIRYLEEKDGELRMISGTICSDWTKDPITLEDPKDRFSGRLNRDIMSVLPSNTILSKTFNAGARAYRPVVPVFEEGTLVGDIETIQLAQARAKRGLAMLDPSHKRLLNPHIFYIGAEESLLTRQGAMGRRLKERADTVYANKI